MKIESEHEIRKAAILLDSLDQQSANLLLGQLNHEVATIVTNQILSLGKVTSKEKESVLADFLKTVQLVAKDNTQTLS